MTNFILKISFFFITELTIFAWIDKMEYLFLILFVFAIYCSLPLQKK